MPQSSTTQPIQNTPNIEIKKKNPWVWIIIILVVIFCAVVLGICAALSAFNNKISNYVSTYSNSDSVQTSYSYASYSAYSTSSMQTSTENSSSSSQISSSAMTSYSASSNSTTNSTATASGLSFSRNEGKYIRFDYPTGWQVNVSAKNGDSFTSFNDISTVTITKQMGSGMFLDFQGGFGCGDSNTYVINSSDTSTLIEQVPNGTPVGNESRTKIARFNAVKLNLPTKESNYLISFRNQDNSLSRQLVKMDGDFYTFTSCSDYGTIDLDNLSFSVGSNTHNLIGMFDGLEKYSDKDLATIIERFVNSFQKK